MVMEEGLIDIDVTAVDDEPELLTVTLMLNDTPLLLENVRVSEPTELPVISPSFSA